jgi:hypothetical protein
VNGEPAPNAGPSPNTGPGKSQPVAKLHYTHEAMIDLILVHPAISNEELALTFVYTASWISTVVVSDIFQAKLAARREQIIDPELRTSVRTQFKGLLERSMEILRHKMDKPAGEVPDQLAVQVAKMASTSLGFGVKETKVSVQETHLHLSELGNNLVGLLRQRKSEAQREQSDSLALPHNSASSRADFGPGRIIDVQVHERGENLPEPGQPQQRQSGNDMPAAGDGPR